MGAWGTSPFSSDSFGEMYDKTRRLLSKSVEYELTDRLHETEEMGAHEPSERWAWIGLVIWAYHAGFDVHEGRGRSKKSLIDEADDILEKLEHDKDFLASWRTPAFKKTLTKVKNQLRDIRGMYEAPGLVPALQDELSNKHGEHNPTEEDEVEADIGVNPCSSNPPGLTAKGEKMYADVKASYEAKGEPRAAEIAARTVYAKAADGVMGLVERAGRPPGVPNPKKRK